MENLQKLTARLRPKFRHLAGWAAGSSLPEIMFLSSFILLRWWQNSDFQYPGEVWLPLIIFSIFGSIVYYLYRWVIGRGLASHAAALLACYALFNYQYVTQNSVGKTVIGIFESAGYFWQNTLFALLILAVAGLSGWGLGRLFRHRMLKQVPLLKVVIFAITFMFSVQLIRSVDRYLDIRVQTTYNFPAAKLGPAPVPGGQKPNIYYMVFDRYASASQLKQQFGYDNSDLMDYLSSQGFYNRDPAFANYPFTMSSVSSTVAMNYFPDLAEQFGEGNWQTAFPYRSILRNPPAAQVLRANGYQYNQVSSWWDFARVGINADSNPTQSFRLRALKLTYFLSDLQRDFINKSVLSVWLKPGFSLGTTPIIKYDLDRNPKENFEAQIAALKTSASSNTPTPQFNFTHFLVPHEPYIFLSDGSEPTYDSNRTDYGVDEQVKYTNQLTYVNKRIKDLIGHIRSNDPGAVIIIQADEGPYPKDFRFSLSQSNYYDPANLKPSEMRQKFSVLASYYLPGVDKDKLQDQVNSVNIFRVVLNHYLGYNLELLPDCHFAVGDKYVIYRYKEVSAQLVGRPAPGCEQYEDQP